MRLRRRIAVVFLLTFLLFLCVLDRYVVAGRLGSVTTFFSLADTSAGLISTFYIVVYVASAPVIGALADRYSRRLVCASGCVVWLAASLLSSLVPGELFWLFCVLRAAGAIGSASLNTIGPPLLAQLFAEDSGRGYALMFFYYALPMGWSASASISSATIANGISWQWTARIATPFAAATLVTFLLTLPEASVKSAKVDSTSSSQRTASSILRDIVAIIKVPSFVLMTLAISCVQAVTDAHGWWNPYLMQLASDATDHDSAIFHGLSLPLILTVYSISTSTGGILGATFTSWLTERWHSPRAASIVGAVAAAISTCTTFVVQRFLMIDVIINYILALIGSFAIFGIYALAMGIVMRVIPEQRRATATAIYYVVSSLLGDAPAASIVGAIADAVRPSLADADGPRAHFYALLDGFYAINPLLGVCAVCFAFSSWSVPRDVVAVAAESVAEAEAVGHAEEASSEQRQEHAPNLQLSNMDNATYGSVVK